MKKSLAPLWVFCSGMFFTLFLFLFLGMIGDQVDELATDSAAIAPVFWNWSWIAQGDVVKFLLVLFAILLTLFATGVAFVKTR